MKIILVMVTSANGIIATKTGSEDFLPNDNWHQFVKHAKKVGCLIWGRKTYDAVSKWDGDYLDDLKDVRKVIVSHGSIELKEGFTLAASPEEAVKLLDKEGFHEAIITGGSTLNSEFAKRNLIDEVVIELNPVLVGEGIPLFAPTDFQLDLQLQGNTTVSNDILELHYRVKK